MISTSEFARMKDGVVVVNCARGGIYEENALAEALKSGKVATAAVDVYEEEPPGKDHPLLNAPNIVLTPHIGANTIEAQDRVAVQTAEMLVDALRGSIFVSAVNLPFEGVADANAAGYIRLSEKLGLLVSQLVRDPITSVSIELRGVDERLSKIITVGALKGVLTRHLSQSVNFVNALAIAEGRGIDVSSTVHPTSHDYTNLLTFRASTEGEDVCISGTLFSEKNLRVVSLNNFRVEFEPNGWLLYMVNKDVPGVVGKVGTILGDREVNIAEYNLARNSDRGVAMAIVNVDSAIDQNTLAFLKSLKEMEEVLLLKL
jgi:D-3-phosphoglycerate dehydrogenase